MKLSKRRIQIANGEKGHSKDVINKYIEQWELEGFDVSEFKPNLIKVESNNSKKIFLLETFNISTGGVERWIIDFIKYYPDKNIEWRIWTHMGAVESQDIMDQMESLAKVFIGLHTLEEACKDVTLCLGCEHIKQEYVKGKSIAVCHGEWHFSERCMDKLKWCDYGVGVSKSALKCFNYLKPTLIYNGIDFNRCFPNKFNIKEELGIEVNKTVIMSISRLSIEKRLHLIIEAAEAMENAVVVFVGSGNKEVELRRYANERNVQCFFAGFKNDIGNYLNIADVFLVVSEQESFCLAGGEAAIAGVPIVATPVGLFKERDDFYKVSFYPNGYEIADQIRNSIADTETTNRLRNYYLDNFNINNFVGNWKKYIDMVLEDN